MIEVTPQLLDAIAELQARPDDPQAQQVAQDLLTALHLLYPKQVTSATRARAFWKLRRAEPGKDVKIIADQVAAEHDCHPRTVIRQAQKLPA